MATPMPKGVGTGSFDLGATRGEDYFSGAPRLEGLESAPGAGVPPDVTSVDAGRQLWDRPGRSTVVWDC